MKTLKSILLAALLGGLISSTAPAQTTTWWRIVNGPGAGVDLEADDFGDVFDDYYEADGFIALGHFTDCECLPFEGHYHGVLFDQPDPDEDGCGWGCVIRVPCTVSEAADALNNAINFVGANLDPDLADKLFDIFELMQDASEAGCYGVVDALADAFSEELEAFFFSTGYLPLLNPTVRALTEFVDSALTTYTPPTLFPLIAMGKVSILHQIGSGSRARLLDAGKRIDLRVGEMLTLQALGQAGLINPIVLWLYQWKGEDQGVLPDGVGTAFYRNHISLVSHKPNTLRLTVNLRYPLMTRPAKDVIMVRWNDYATR